MLVATTLYLQIIAQGNIHTATLNIENAKTFIAQITIPDKLHDQVNQLLTSMRGKAENVITVGLPVNIEKLEAETIALLHKHIFDNVIGEAIKQELTERDVNQELILLISSSDARIRNLPWEMIGFQNWKINIVRTQQPSLKTFQQKLLAPKAAPLKLLFVTALPENIDERHKQLQIEDEQRKLIEAVHNLEATGNRQPKMVIEFLDVASLSEITQALRARQHDILHVSGHGKFQEDVKRGILYLENEDGDLAETDGAAFAEAVRAMPGLRLVVLSACETAVAGPDGGTAEAIALAGIPAVLGMRFSVGDTTAKLFMAEFYQHLANGATITAAIAAGRLVMHELVEQWREQTGKPILSEWFTPVLYLTGVVGALVDTALPYSFPRDFYPAPAADAGKSKRLIGTGFIGRKRHLIRMRKAFREEKHVCLVGMGGIGKTTLAEAFARSYENGGHRMIFWRGGTEINEFGILNQIVLAYGRWHKGVNLRALREGIENGEMTFVNRLHDVIQQCLAGEKTILMFDNFEDLQDQTGGENSRSIQNNGLGEVLHYLLDNTPEGCHILFTTRYKIEGLSDLIEIIDLDKLSPAEQYRWLTYSRELCKISAKNREGIYQRLDGLPRAYQFLEALARNKRDFDWNNLETELGKVEARVFENLMLEQIYGLLDADLQRVFLVVSVFFTRTPIGALVAVLEEQFSKVDLSDYLGQLSNWGLSFFDEGLMEFEVHGLIRDWIAGQNMLLVEGRKQVAAMAGKYFNSNASANNYELAIGYFGLAEDWNMFVDVSMKLQHHYQRIGLYARALELCQVIVVKNVDNHTKRGALNNIALYERILGNYDIALAHYGKVMNMCRSDRDQKMELKIVNNISQIHALQGNHPMALQHLNKSLELSLKLGDQFGVGAALNNIGQILNSQGNYHDAKRYFEQSYEINKATGNRNEEGIAINNLATIAYKRGDLERASEYYEQSLSIKVELGDLRGLALAFSNLGTIARALGRVDEALEFYEQSIEIRIEIGDKIGESVNLGNIGQIHIARKSYAKGKSYLLRALEISKEIGDKPGEGILLNNLGQLFDELGDHDQAFQYLKEGLQISEQAEEIEGITANLHNLGMILFNQNLLEEAIPYLLKSYRINTQIGSPNSKNSGAHLLAIATSIGQARYETILSTLDLQNL